jgi:CBS domain-containing protein
MKEGRSMADPNSPVREVMSRGAITIDEKLTLRAMAAVLAQADIGIALIGRADGSAGIVSERDVIRALADDADADEVWAADIMADSLVFAEPEETIMLNRITVALRRNQEKARTRRQDRTLLSLDDHVLRDIGVRRHEILARMAGL